MQALARITISHIVHILTKVHCQGSNYVPMARLALWEVDTSCDIVPSTLHYILRPMFDAAFRRAQSKGWGNGGGESSFWEIGVLMIQLPWIALQLDLAVELQREGRYVELRLKKMGSAFLLVTNSRMNDKLFFSTQGTTKYRL